MWVARTVWEIRSSSRHFRIVLPGWSDRAISPAIFSRSGNSIGKRHEEVYISVSKTLSAFDETSPGRPTTWPLTLQHRSPMSAIRRTLIHKPKLTASPRRVRGVAWSILGGSGPLDSGSNPDGPISLEGSANSVPASPLSDRTQLSVVRDRTREDACTERAPPSLVRIPSWPQGVSTKRVFPLTDSSKETPPGIKAVIPSSAPAGTSSPRTRVTVSTALTVVPKLSLAVTAKTSTPPWKFRGRP